MNNYQYIINPKNNKKYKITSKRGQVILRNHQNKEINNFLKHYIYNKIQQQWDIQTTQASQQMQF